MRLTEDARGVYIIAATPFGPDGALDLASLDRLVDFYLERGVDGLTLLGLMGEAQKLTAEEARTVVRRVLARVNGRVPVVVGVSSAGLAPLAALSHAAMDAGAAAVMVAPAPGLRGDEGLFAYVEAVVAVLGPAIPLVFQDYPQATGVHLTVPLFHRLVEAFPQLVMLKHEDSPGLAKLTRLRAEATRDQRRRVSILVGNGALYYPEELARGADGAMTGFSYPEMLVDVWRRFIAGDVSDAEDLFDAYLPLVRYEHQPVVGLAIRKEILRRRGAIACAAVRPPAPVLSREDQRELDRIVDRLERRLNGA